MCLAEEEVEEKHDIGVQVLLYKGSTLSFFLVETMLDAAGTEARTLAGGFP